jgi:hypothetical protein
MRATSGARWVAGQSPNGDDETEESAAAMHGMPAMVRAGGVCSYHAKGVWELPRSAASAAGALEERESA